MAIVVKRKEYKKIDSYRDTQMYKTFGRIGVKCVHDTMRVTMADGTQFIGKMKSFWGSGGIDVEIAPGVVREKIDPSSNLVEVLVND